MAKLLIVDDQIKMAGIIQEYMQQINQSFSKDNTFCFASQDGNLRLLSLSELGQDSDHFLMVGKKKEVFSSVFQFLSEHTNENVLIMIDVLLNSTNISAPSYERYRADEEYSCELYAELLRFKNGKAGKWTVNPEKFFHIIYSRSDASIGVVMTVLQELYDNQAEGDKAYFPKDCVLFNNISWCRNCCESTDEHFEVTASEDEKNQPIALPKGYLEFFKTL